jgi:hypothetical protein
MLTNTKAMKGFTVHAKDGELGRIDQFYFDDESWAIRYFTIETGGWLAGRSVLISPISVTGTDWDGKRLHVSLTKQQVENSPSIDTRKPVSRQHEAEYMGYYGYPYYWGGPMMWGPSYFPAGLAIPTEAVPAGAAPKQSSDTHLRCVEGVTGYSISANDGEIGHVDGFLVDDTAWAIRYMEVATRNWWPGKKVLISPAWIDQISWLRSTVTVDMSRESVRSAPEYVESAPVTRAFEESLSRHYGRPPWWLHEEAGQKSALDLIGARK